MTVFAPGWRPATDVVETPSTIEVRLELPGVDLQDIDLSLTGTVLVVKGRRRLPEISPSAIYHLVEIQHGVFPDRGRPPNAGGREA